jgi:hypothetical protein
MDECLIALISKWLVLGILRLEKMNFHEVDF